MLELNLDVEDLADTRFAVSPLAEAILSVRVWMLPGYYVMQLPWLEQAKGDIGDLDIALLHTLVGPWRAVPDFLTPRPEEPVPEFAAELDRVRATPPEKVVAHIMVAHRGRPVPARLAAELYRPARLRDRILELLAAYWDATLARHWPRMRGVLEADMLYRAQRLAYGGARTLFADLHPAIRWRDGRLRVDLAVPYPHDRLAITGRGLCIMPAVFVKTPGLPLNLDEPPLINYPARGTATIWETAPPSPPGTLAALIGEPKAKILASLERPTSTTDLARRLGVTPGAVSQHLAVLYAASLVSRARAGRTVLYARTDLGHRLTDPG